MEQVHIDGWLFGVVGFAFVVLLSIIAVFLRRLLAQFDGVQQELRDLNRTMLRIDKDLSGDVSVLKSENVTLKEKVDDLDNLWDRMRAAETSLASIKAGGCDAHKAGKCEQ